MYFIRNVDKSPIRGDVYGDGFQEHIILDTVKEAYECVGFLRQFHSNEFDPRIFVLIDQEFVLLK